MLERWRARSLLLLESGVWDGEREYPGFDAWCAANPGRACELWLSSALVMELVCEPGLPIADDAAALAWARSLMQHYHGERAAAWPLAAWQQGRRRGVSALHGVPLEKLQLAARQAKVRLQAVRPWWSLVLRSALRKHASLRAPAARLLVVEGTRIAVIDLERGEVANLQLRRLDSSVPGALQRWCDEAGKVSTLAIGYGLGAGALEGAELPDSLDSRWPARRWLTGAWA